jgi:hypothetical protein
MLSNRMKIHSFRVGMSKTVPEYVKTTIVSYNIAQK